MRCYRRAVRWATLVLVVVLGGCNDLRDFSGTWQGERVGEAAVVRVGVAMNARATLTVEAIDSHGFSGHLVVDGIADADLASLAGAEADALAGMTFAGSPLRVYLAFVPTHDAGGEALAVIALYDDHRVEVRLLRGGTTPLYAIFALKEQT